MTNPKLIGYTEMLQKSDQVLYPNPIFNIHGLDIWMDISMTQISCIKTARGGYYCQAQSPAPAPGQGPGQDP